MPPKTEADLRAWEAERGFVGRRRRLRKRVIALDFEKGRSAAKMDTGTFGPTVHESCMALVNSADAPAVAPKAVVENGLKNVDFVFTGVFDCGGGTGLKRGKEGLQKLTKRAGANFRTAITKKTNYLVVGARPGNSKVALANKHPTALVIDAGEFQKLLEDPTYKPMPAVFNDNTAWSAGFNGNGRGYVYNPSSPAHSPCCPDGVTFSDHKPARPEERFAPDVDAHARQSLPDGECAAGSSA